MISSLINRKIVVIDYAGFLQNMEAGISLGPGYIFREANKY